MGDIRIDHLTWRLLQPASLMWRCWDDEYVVFHPFSGMTHYLDAIAGAVFELLLDHAGTARELTVSVADLAETPVSENLADAVRQVLRRFEEVGLAEPVP
jgi:PqqD family protein of HPr-rel-A system